MSNSGNSLKKYPFVLLFLLIFGLIFASCGDAGYDAPSDKSPLFDENLRMAVNEFIEENDMDDVHTEFNIKIPVTKSENPVGYESNLWVTAMWHTSNYNNTKSIKRPTILLATGYERALMSIMRQVAVFLPYDYNIVSVDMRGTGSAEGVWDPLGPIEQYDVVHLIDKWIPSQPWSDGTVAMAGGSYEAILQLLAAGLVEKDKYGNAVHLKAIAPFSAYNDVYKDIVMHGGNYEKEFLDVWIEITQFISVLPPDLLAGGITKSGFNFADFKEAMNIWDEHMDQLSLANDMIYDPARELKDSWYETKSPMIYWADKPAGGWDFGPDMPKEVGGGVIPKSLPVFTSTGWYDIFLRGALLNWEYGFKYHAATDKNMIIGPWYHVDAAYMITGIEGLGIIGRKGMFTWDILRRWMDRKYKGKNDPFNEEFPVVMYVLGENKWRAEKSWPLAPSRLSDRTFYLSKDRPSLISGDWFSMANRAGNYKLVPAVSANDYNDVLQNAEMPRANPVLVHDPADLHGTTSRSNKRWFGFAPQTAITQMIQYVLGININPTLPWEDERNDEENVLTFTTEPLESDLEISGPLTLTFWAKTMLADEPVEKTGKDGLDNFLDGLKETYTASNNVVLKMIERKDVQWIIEVNDVFPSGRAPNVTSGWMSAAFRPYDPENPTRVDPAYTAFDPFYSYSEKNPDFIEEDTIYQYVIEIWPTTNVFKKGHRVRLSISGSDYPHLLPVLYASENTIVIDEEHQARLDFKAANRSGEGTEWKWIDENISDYLMTH